jgi:glutathione synthase
MRSNISLGGTAEIIQLDQQQVAICERIAKHLNADGIVFSGLDLIGDKVVEVNVFSPSGLQEFQATFDSEIAVNVVQCLLGKT